jgi:hypothetical protein
MHNKLGNQGAISLLADLAVLTIPIPFILRRYGIKLRRRSPWARIHAERGGEHDEKRGEESTFTSLLTESKASGGQKELVSPLLSTGGKLPSRG